MAIPKHIHQTWKNEDVPDHLRGFALSWRKQHPDWSYTLWTDDMNRNFIVTHYPDFLHVYDSYPTPIQRVDAVRYFILLKMGGVFVDLDFECLKNISPLLSDITFMAGMEPPLHAAWHNKEYIISNALMAAATGCKFLETVCQILRKNDDYQNYQGQGFNGILDCTGPFMLSRCYAKYEAKETIRIADYTLLYPLVKDIYTGKINMADRQNTSLIEKAYAIHYYWGSWWQRAG